MNKYPCPLCDYLFTLATAMAVSGVIHLSHGPWWLIVLASHWMVASFFMGTRK